MPPMLRGLIFILRSSILSRFVIHGSFGRQLLPQHLPPFLILVAVDLPLGETLLKYVKR